jgi:chemotaxis protein MotB
MKAVISVLASLLGLSIASGTYLYLAQYKPMENASKKTEIRNQELNREVNDLRQELNLKVAEISKARKEKEAEIARVQATRDSLVAEMTREIQDNQIQITQLADKLKVSIVDKILFPSGEAKITGEGLKVLQRVGDILKNTKDNVIRVEGHTDNVPISGALKYKFPSNWELSTARATNVVRFLEDKVGIDPAKLEAVGLGENQPVASNETAQGRAQNRRIEIALLPIK